MTWLWVLMTLIVLGGTAAVAVGHGASLRRAHPDRPDVRLPADRSMTADDLAQVQFSVVMRGYRMDEVDDLLHRLAEELAARDALLARYERSGPHQIAYGRARGEGSEPPRNGLDSPSDGRSPHT